MLNEMGLVRLYSTPKTSSGVLNAEKSSFCHCQQDMQRKSLEKQKSKCQMNSDQIVRRVYLYPQILPDTCRCEKKIRHGTNKTYNLKPASTIIQSSFIQSR